MTKRFEAFLRRLLRSGLSGLAGWALAGAGSAPAAVVTNVNIIDNAFSPASVAVNVGDQVRWTWVGVAPHSTTSTGGLWDSGLHTPPYAFTNLFAAAGNFPYICTLHGFAGSVAVQSVGNVAPAIVTPPHSQTIESGRNVTFTVSATGTPPLSYQWQFDTLALMGATGSALRLTNVQSGDAGSYRVVVTNSAGAVTSATAVLTVLAGGPFTPMKASYNGLFFDTNAVSQASSGSFTIVETAAGKFSGSLVLGGARHSLSGQFDGLGHATQTFGSGTNAVTVELQVDLADTDQLGGTVSNASWTVYLVGDRAVFDAHQNPAPQAGLYTLTIAGAEGSNLLPGGSGYGTLSVDATGKLRLAGALADGTRITQSTTLSKNGDWPFYIALYGTRGSVLGWFRFLGTATNDLGGEVTWFKPGPSNARFYPAGFAFTTQVTGYRYHRRGAGTNELSFANAVAVFSGGDLAQAMTNHFTLGRNNRVSNLSTNRLTLTFQAATGAFSGRVMNPANSQMMLFNGVALQDGQFGLGFFLGPTQSGEVLLAPEP